MTNLGAKTHFYWRFDVAAEQFAEKRVVGPSGVKTLKKKQTLCHA
jgi:hypothetical protein